MKCDSHGLLATEMAFCCFWFFFKSWLCETLTHSVFWNCKTVNVSLGLHTMF